MASKYRPSALTACRRKRRSATLESDASPWASLNQDLVGLIGWRVLAGDLLDYVRFRAVCTGWRSSTICPRGRGLHDPRFHPRRWMMLPEGQGLYPGHGKLRKYIRFINLSTGAIVRSKLPLFSDHCVLDSTEGILVLQRDRDTAVILLHPFTGDNAQLPPLAPLRTMLSAIQEPYIDWSLYRNIGATSFSVSADGVVTVMIAFLYLTRVACATTMDQQWQLSTWTISNVWRPMSFQGKIYTVHCDNTLYNEVEILQIDLPRQGEKIDIGGVLCHLPEPKLVATFPAGKLYAPYRLAECDSDILLIGHKGRGASSHFEVYRLADIVIDKVVPVTSIGTNALFIEDRILSVSSRVHPTIVADALACRHPEEHYIGQYHLATATWFPKADIRSGSIPSPCSLINHILSCCHRPTWNKGAIIFHGMRKPATWKVKRKFRLGA